uniref:Uncharacterized protein n=1 Tax=Thermosporothrix sp. COM3 TaxID=2490863 RepID=A0A455SGY7_9CHLR|nr:hypothetical protein KTC_24780 [Thermosporothrix sp. COM3]
MRALRAHNLLFIEGKRLYCSYDTEGARRMEGMESEESTKSTDSMEDMNCLDSEE